MDGGAYSSGSKGQKAIDLTDIAFRLVSCITRTRWVAVQIWHIALVRHFYAGGAGDFTGGTSQIYLRCVGRTALVDSQDSRGHDDMCEEEVHPLIEWPGVVDVFIRCKRAVISVLR